MIGLLVLAVLAGYIILSIIVISVVYKKTKNIKKMFIALAIMILIPTWDVIIGYPIYKFLCWTSAGVHIYKTVDNVEGFYVGEQQNQYEPVKPYDGYKYVDYKEMDFSKPTGKYYRSYWLDSNSSKECIKPRYPDSPYDEYTKAFKQGKCIVKEEMAESEVSRWEYDTNRNIHKVVVPIVKIEKTVVAIRDRNQNQNIAENIRYNLDQNWVIGIMNESINTRGVLAYCSGGKNMLEKVLKITNQEEK